MAYHSNVRTDIVPLVPQAERLLDVGGGTGETARYLKEIGRVAQAGVMDAVVDKHSDGLDFWSSANLNDGSAVDRFLEEQGALDVILLLDVVEHLLDPWAIVAVLSRHLKPGGVMIASIPNIRYYSVVRDLVFRNRWRYADSGLLDRTHLRFFVQDTAIELMTAPGLTLQSVVPAAISSAKWRVFNALTFGVFRSFFAQQFFVTVRRDA